MIKYYSKRIETRIRALGIYQIAGGGTGIFLNIKFLITNTEVPDLLILLFLISTCLYCYSILAGIFILTKKDNELRYSLINQYLQLVSFSILGYSFTYASGIYLFCGIDFTDLINFKFTAGVSSWYISFNIVSKHMEINLNLVAIFLIIFIDRIKKKYKEDQTEISISEILNSPSDLQ